MKSLISSLYSCSVLTANGNLSIRLAGGVSLSSPSATTHLLICGGLSGPVPSVWSVLTHRCFVLPPAVCRNGSESPVCPSHIAECQALDWLLHRKSQLMLQKSYSSSSPDTELCLWCVWMLYFTVHSQWFSPAGSCSQSIGPKQYTVYNQHLLLMIYCIIFFICMVLKFVRMLQVLICICFVYIYKAIINLGWIPFEYSY